MTIECSLVIPCFNEEGNIDTLIKRCSNFLANPKNELILVNNGSTDKTEQKIDYYLKSQKIIKVSIKKNIGFGNGLKEGFKVCSGNKISYTHADNECDPNDVLNGLKIYDQKNKEENIILVKGKRVNKLQNGWSFVDIFMSKGMSIFESILFRMNLNDIHGQPVIFSKSFLKLLENAPNDFLLDLYIMVIAKKKKIPIYRFPVIFNKKGRIYGTPNNSTFFSKINSAIKHVKSSVTNFYKW